MYELIRKIVVPLLRVDEAQPHPPAGHLPHDRVQVIRAAPAYLNYRLALWGLYAAVWAAGVAVASVAILLTMPMGLLLVIPLAIFALFKATVLYVVTRLDYEMRWYVITERSLLIRQGVWFVREITLTFANAQNVRVTQGPLQRLFGISNIEIDTAGGGAARQEKKGLEFDPHRAVLRGIDRPGDLRSQIVGLVKQQRSAGLGDPDDPDHAASGPDPMLLREILDEARRIKNAIAGTR